jgi:ketosteroid isomerase-like protein
MRMPSARSIVVFAAAALVMGVAARAEQNQSTAAGEREMREAITQFGTAYGANDLDKYFSFMADDMTAWWGTRGRNESPTPKAQYMKTWPDNVKNTGGYEGCKLNDLRVQVGPSGDAGVGSYILDCIRKNPPQGQKPPISFEMSVVMFKRANAWKVVHWNWKPLAAPAATGPR